MVKVIVAESNFYLDQNLKDALDEVKRVVKNKDFDYVAILAGIPGMGKSTYAQQMAKYCCDWFDENYIAFDANSFISVTNECKPGSAVILDESFESMNSKSSMSSEFVRIVNHLQIIRQKNLFIFLCLPNFFDLAKGIAIYRAHHLFVCYSAEYGTRGSFAAYSRDSKKNLYILGKKFMNYNAVKPNFRGRFTKARVLNWEKYEEMKKKHLMSQSMKLPNKRDQSRNKLIYYMKNNLGISVKEISDISGMAERTIYDCLTAHSNWAPTA